MSEWPQPPQLSNAGKAATSGAQPRSGDDPRAGLNVTLPGDPPDVQAFMQERRGEEARALSPRRFPPGEDPSLRELRAIRVLLADIKDVLVLSHYGEEDE